MLHPEKIEKDPIDFGLKDLQFSIFWFKNFVIQDPKLPRLILGMAWSPKASEGTALDLPSTAGMDGSGIPSTTRLEEHLILGPFH